MLEATWPSFVTFALYFLLMVLVGLWVYRRTVSLSDFVLGGRQLNSWVAGLSANASDFSAWLLLGLPGAFYLSGMGEIWLPIGLAVGFYLSWRIVAPRLRVSTERVTDLRTGAASNSLTLSAYLENRFADRTRLLRLVSALFTLVFYFFYVGSGLVGMGLVFNQVFGMEPAYAILAGTTVIVLYTFLGGFLAVSLTDVIQAAMMALTLLVVPVLAIVAMGGFGSMVEGITARNEDLLSVVGDVALEDGAWQSGDAVGAIAIISLLAWGFGYFGQPHILARFMGIRSTAEIPHARRISVTWAAAAMALAALVGLAGLAYLDTPLDDDNHELVLPMLIDALTHPLVGGILLAAILAAIMSTADSQLLVASSALAEDGYRAFVRQDAPPKVLVWVGRGAVIAVAAMACLVALTTEETILALVGYAWAGFGASFGTVILFALYWRRMNWVGALAGLLGGGLTVLIYPQFDQIGLYEMVPGVVVAVLAILVCNPLGPRPTDGMGTDFDGVRGEVGVRS